MNIYEAALAKWGENAQLKQLAEECSELAVEALHRAKGRQNHNKLLEELIDCELMIEQMKLVYDPVTWAQMRKLKEAKLQKALAVEPRMPEVANE